MACVGQIINGKYKILRLTGKRGTSDIFAAEDIHLSKMLFIREIPKYSGGKENYAEIKSAISETHINKSLDSASIIKIADILDDGKSIFIAEEHVKGISIKEYAEKGKVIDEKLIANWLLQICQILKYLHDREPPVYLKQVRPEDFIITDSNYLVLVNLENACRTRKNHLNYYDSEINSLGQMASYLKKFCKNKSRKLNRIIGKCTNKYPTKRYRNICEIEDEIKMFTGNSKFKPYKKISLFRILFAVMAVVLTAGAIYAVTSRKEAALVTEERINRYIEEVKQDFSFTTDEEETLLGMLEGAADIMDEESYGKLIFEIGKLYWFYYSYARENNVGKVSSIYWFGKISDINRTASLYKKIGEFYKNINEAAFESSDEGMYGDFFGNLKKLMEEETENMQENLRLEMCSLAINSLETYLRKIRRDGISFDSVTEYIELAGQITEDTNATSEQEDLLKEEILKKIPDAESRVKTVYSGDEEER